MSFHHRFRADPSSHSLPSVSDVKSTPEGGIAGGAAGVGNATSGSVTDQLTRQHRMTFDEASLILNVKKDADLQQVMKASQAQPIAFEALSNAVPCRITSTSSRPTLLHPNRRSLSNPSAGTHRSPLTHTICNRRLYGPRSDGKQSSRRLESLRRIRHRKRRHHHHPDRHQTLPLLQADPDFCIGSLGRRGHFGDDASAAMYYFIVLFLHLIRLPHSDIIQHQKRVPSTPFDAASTLDPYPV